MNKLKEIFTELLLILFHLSWTGAIVLYICFFDFYLMDFLSFILGKDASFLMIVYFAYTSLLILQLLYINYAINKLKPAVIAIILFIIYLLMVAFIPEYKYQKELSNCIDDTSTCPSYIKLNGG